MRNKTNAAVLYVRDTIRATNNWSLHQTFNIYTKSDNAIVIEPPDYEVVFNEQYIYIIN